MMEHIKDNSNETVELNNDELEKVTGGGVDRYGLKPPGISLQPPGFSLQPPDFSQRGELQFTFECPTKYGGCGNIFTAETRGTSCPNCGSTTLIPIR